MSTFGTALCDISYHEAAASVDVAPHA
jgi:hypothetical protein